MAYRENWGSGRRSRRRLVAVVGVLAVVAGVGVALLVAPHLGTVFGTASNTANVADCAAPGAASPTAPAPGAPPGTASDPATSAGTVSGSAAPNAAGPAVPGAAVSGMSAADAAAGSSTSAATPTTPDPAATAPASAAATPPGSAAAGAPPATAPAATAPAATAPATTAPATTAPATSTATASGAATASATPTPANCATATASATPAAVSAANVSCDIVVPARPLTAAGLATPYQLTGPDGMSPAASGCTMANATNLGAFVQATILNRVTGRLSVYEPLVITQGTTAAAAPVLPRLPRHAVVTIDFGFNGTNLTQVGATSGALAEGRCVNGEPGSIFGQVSFCNGTRFFRAAFRAEREGRLRIPAIGTSPKTGQPCPTTRSFTLVDQDPSDNVTTTYLLTASGQTAQFNAVNKAALAGAMPINNGSDNELLDAFLDPTIGCTPFEARDLSQAGAPGTSQALDELSAARNQQAPVALVPENDEMVLVNNAFSVPKTDLYRAEVGQPLVSPLTVASDPASFCQNMVNIQTPFLASNQALLTTGATPVPGVGDNLLTFMANRLNMSFTNLNCQNFGLTNPVTVTLDANGAATAATFNTAPQRVTNPGLTQLPRPGHRMGRGHHRLMDPSGM